MTVEIKNKILVVADTLLADGRFFPREVILNWADNQKEEYFGSFINVDFFNNPEKVAISANNLRVESNVLLCDFKVLDTLYGIMLQKYIREHQFMLTPKCNKNNDSEIELQEINVKLT